MSERYLGESIPKLGFGYMRLPRNADGESFDLPQICNMVDTYLENGFTYFDTAFVYQGSEEALRETLIKRHPREKYQIASKLNLMFAKDRKGMEEQFETTMSRLDTPYLDFYLLHGLGGPSIKMAEDIGGWEYMQELKDAGKIKHICLSFHGTPEELDELLTKHPEAEFVQLQINYLDWESTPTQSRRLYEIARAHNTPVVIMEPLLGGSLASDTVSWSDGFKNAAPNDSVASWAFRFLAELDGLVTILSGMSSYDQLVDNVKTFKSLKPLTDADRELITQTAAAIKAIPGVPCTSCRYCVEQCPAKINIPGMMNLYTNYLMYNNATTLKHSYGFMTRDAGKAKDCVGCRLCESHCPQHIEIADIIEKLSPLVD